VSKLSAPNSSAEPGPLRALLRHADDNNDVINLSIHLCTINQVKYLVNIHAVQLSQNKLNINPTYTKLAVFYTQHEVRHEYI